MATGDADDFLGRLKKLLPTRWFNVTAPIRDAVLGGISDALAWAYSLNAFVKLQERLGMATGQFIDLFAFDYLGLTIRRRVGELDAPFAARVKKEILRPRVTRAAMIEAITDFAGTPPTIIEPWNPSDTGAWDIPETAYDVGGARWGDTTPLPSALIIFPPEVVSGPPSIPGWDVPQAAWDTNSTAYFDAPQSESYEAEAYEVINETKPIGVPIWVQFAEGTVVFDAITSDWILATGFWDDGGLWDDSSFWID